MHWYINQIRFGIEVKIRKGKLLWIATKVIMGFTFYEAAMLFFAYSFSDSLAAQPRKFCENRIEIPLPNMPEGSAFRDLLISLF